MGAEGGREEEEEACLVVVEEGWSASGKRRSTSSSVRAPALNCSLPRSSLCNVATCAEEQGNSEV